jgi:signal transduction histidine kinase
VKAGTAYIQKIILFSILIGMLIAFGLSFLTNASLVKPLVKMRNTAEQMAKGNYHQKLEVNSTDELGNLAASFNTLSEEVQKKITVITEFVANVSHEIKTPITAIGGAVETLLSGAIHNEKEAKEFLEIALNHTNRLNNIVDDLLALSKIETKEIKIDFVPVNLKNLINNVVKLLGDSIHLKNQLLNIDIPVDIPKIPADEKKLEQVFFNLLDNAIKFTPENGKISVRVENLQDTVRIDISDTGIGIPDEHINRIFERFYRVDAARSREMGGTGLGLAIVKHIIQLHNGRITVESRPGKGSSFSVFLPKTS